MNGIIVTEQNQAIMYEVAIEKLGQSIQLIYALINTEKAKAQWLITRLRLT